MIKKSKVLLQQIVLRYNRAINMLNIKNGHTTLFLVFYWHYNTSRTLNSSIIAPYGPLFRHIHRRPSRPAAIVRSFLTIKHFKGWSCNPTPPTLILEIQGNTLTCPTWQVLPAAALPSPYFSVSFSHAAPTTTPKYRYLRWRDMSLYMQCLFLLHRITVEPAYNGTARDLFFFHLQGGFVLCRYLKFGSLGLHELGNVKFFPLKTGSRYAQVPFKIGFTVIYAWISTIWLLPQHNPQKSQQFYQEYLQVVTTATPTTITTQRTLTTHYWPQQF